MGEPNSSVSEYKIHAQPTHDGEWSKWLAEVKKVSQKAGFWKYINPYRHKVPRLPSWIVTDPSVEEEIQMAKLLVMKGYLTEEERKAEIDTQRKSTYMDLTEAIKISSRRGVLFIFENDLRKVLLIIKKDILAYPGRRKATRKLWKRVSTTPPPKLDTSDKLYAWLMKWEHVYGKGKNCKCELFYDDDIVINAFLRIIKPRHPCFWDAEFYRFLGPIFTERSFSEVIQRFTISALYRILHGQPV